MYNAIWGGLAMFYDRNGDCTLGYTYTIGFGLLKNTQHCYFALNLCWNFYTLTLAVKWSVSFSQFEPNYFFLSLIVRDKS